MNQELTREMILDGMKKGTVAIVSDVGYYSDFLDPDEPCYCYSELGCHIGEVGFCFGAEVDREMPVAQFYATFSKEEIADKILAIIEMMHADDREYCARYILSPHRIDENEAAGILTWYDPAFIPSHELVAVGCEKLPVNAFDSIIFHTLYCLWTRRIQIIFSLGAFGVEGLAWRVGDFAANFLEYVDRWQTPQHFCEKYTEQEIACMVAEALGWQPARDLSYCVQRLMEI